MLGGWGGRFTGYICQSHEIYATRCFGHCLNYQQCRSIYQTKVQVCLNLFKKERGFTSEEDLEPDLVRDIKTLRSLMMTRWTSLMELRSFFLDTSCRGTELIKLSEPATPLLKIFVKKKKRPRLPSCACQAQQWAVLVSHPRPPYPFHPRHPDQRSTWGWPACRGWPGPHLHCGAEKGAEASAPVA